MKCLKPAERICGLLLVENLGRGDASPKRTRKNSENPGKSRQIPLDISFWVWYTINVKVHHIVFSVNFSLYSEKTPTCEAASRKSLRFFMRRYRLAKKGWILWDL